MATFVYCILDGTLMGMWLVQTPAVEKRAGISHAALGSLLVLLGLGAFIGIQVAGRWPTDSARASWSPPPACCAARLSYAGPSPGALGAGRRAAGVRLQQTAAWM